MTGRKARSRAQWQQLLDVLSDGRWHTAAELYGGLRFVVHSRISDLRKKGYVIEVDRNGVGAEHYSYRLVSQPHPAQRPRDVVAVCLELVATAGEPPLGVVCGRERPCPIHDVEPSTREPEQLSLEAA